MLAVTPRMRFPGRCFRVIQNLQKSEKMCDFQFFHHRTGVYQRHTQKRQKMKTVFESIPIPKYAFSKNKNKNSLKPQVQRLMKTVDF